ncbi:hypothetical protein G6011_02700 [Alternaria panax]|uniref:BTB domain-containing protein n=1 Tax=Alternaria panax TaxID=48097 RepID=A0AAD4F968_9PLEO|nr:hypothetical protein G6011_02700 [Alternaria panax]
MSFSCPPHILKAYKNGDFTDLVIGCGSSTFDVHSVVVGAGCEFFAKSLNFGDYDPTDDFGIAALEQLKQYESITAAAPAHHHRKGVFGSPHQPYDRCACLALNSKNIEQPALDKKAPHRIKIRKPDNSVEIANPLTIHATMYALADKYQADGLSRVAKAKFQESLDCHVDSEDFIAAVQLTYGNTPESNRGLRDVIVQAFLSYFKVDITELPALESKLDTIDELSFLLLKSWPRRTEPTSPPKPMSSAFVAPTAPNAGISTASSTSSTVASTTSNTSSPFGIVGTPSSRGNTSAITPATGSLFGSLPPRTSGGFGSFHSSLNNHGNAQMSQPSLFGTR